MKNKPTDKEVLAVAKNIFEHCVRQSKKRKWTAFDPTWWNLVKESKTKPHYAEGLGRFLDAARWHLKNK